MAKQLKEGKMHVAPSVCVQFLTAEHPGWQEHAAAGCIASRVRSREHELMHTGWLSSGCFLTV